MPRISLEDSLLFQYGVLWNFEMENKSNYSLTLYTFNVICWFSLLFFVHWSERKEFGDIEDVHVQGKVLTL